jgi:hypothetical protein
LLGEGRNKGGWVVTNATVSRAIPRQTSEHLTEGALTEVATLAWKRLTGATLRPARSAASDRFAVSAQLQLAGMDSTVVVVRASREAATAAAVGMLGLQPGEVGAGDIADAFAELAVTVGCGVRALLAGLTKLDPPVVVQGESIQTAIPGARMLCESRLKTGEGPVHVSLWRPRSARRIARHSV